MKTVGNEMTFLQIEQFPELEMCAVFSFKLKIMKKASWLFVSESRDFNNKLREITEMIL